MRAEKVGPLEVLIKKLKSRGLPSLEALIAQIGDLEGYLEFLRIIRELLPEHEAEILRESTIPEQIGVFTSRFEPRYFPIGGGVWEWDWVETYNDFCFRMPIQLEGISWDEYEELA